MTGPALPHVPILLQVADTLSNKIRWVFETLCPAAGVRPQFVTDREQASRCVLAYAAAPVAGVPTIPASPAARELIEARRPLPPQSYRRVRFGQADGGLSRGPHSVLDALDTEELVGAFFAEATGFALPFDLVASAFLLLVCWDELTRPERDRHGRLPFSASLFAENAALRLEEPACDAYATWLRSVIAERCAALKLPPPAPPPPFTVALTHDVDGLRRWTTRGWLAWARRLTLSLMHRDWGSARFEAGAAAYHLRHDLPRGRDPAYTFPELLAEEDARGVSSTFFIIASHQHRTDGNQPGVYRRLRPQLLALLAAARREVGLHGNHRDAIDIASLMADRAALAAAAGLAVDGIRYHYLKCLYHTSLPLLERAGFTYDSSLAFAEHEGFRCGFSHPFHPYHVAEDRPLTIVELPLAVMDSTLQERHYRHLTADEAREAAVAVLERARATGGTCAILWHHNRFHPYIGRGYGDAFWDVVDWVKRRGGRCLTAGDAVARWKEWLSAGSGVPREPVDDAGEPRSRARDRLAQRTAEQAGDDRPRVVHVSVVHTADDPRIFERECRSLADVGYEVTYLAPGTGSGCIDGVHLAGLPARPRTTRWMSAGPLLAEVHRLRPDVVHIHDPELLTLFPVLRPLVGSLIYDMHEYVSEAVESKYYIPARLRPLAARLTVASQRSLASLADGIIAVTDEQFTQVGSRPEARITLPNYPRFSRFRDARPRPETVHEQRLKLIYIGSLTRTRGVDMMLEALAQVPDAVLYLGGTFSNPSFEAEVRAAAAGPLAGRLHLLGRVPPAEVPGWLAGADVVWVPAKRTSQYARPTVATKLFEGMAVGLAVLVSDLPGRGDVVREADCGLAVAPDPQGHLDGLRRLAADRAAVKAMGARARAAVEAHYSWEAIEGRLVDFYAELLARRQRAMRTSRAP